MAGNLYSKIYRSSAPALAGEASEGYLLFWLIHACYLEIDDEMRSRDQIWDRVGAIKAERQICGEFLWKVVARVYCIVIVKIQLIILFFVNISEELFIYAQMDMRTTPGARR